MNIFSLVRKDETHITMKSTQTSNDCPYMENLETWVVWDIMTPNPLSQQTVHRLIFKFKWIGSKPIVSGTIED